MARSDERRAAGLSRRALLKTTGWSALGLTVLSGCRLLPVFPSRPTPSLNEGLVWVQVTPNGQFLLQLPRQEMGQGASLGLTQVVAEELGIAPEHIRAVLPSTDTAPVARATVGSESISLFAEPLARAAATLRTALIGRAAEALGVQTVQIEMQLDGRLAGPQGRAISTAELVRGRPLVLEANPQAVLRSQGPGPKRWLGSSLPSPDLRAIVTGAPLFASDVRVPKMLHGQAVPPPRFGARLTVIDASAARAVPGVVAIVEDLDGGFVGVVAESVEAVHSARSQLKLQWGEGSTVGQAALQAQVDVDQHLRDGALEHTLLDEDPECDAPWQVDLRFDVPMAAHAPMEPRVAVAHVLDDRAEVWVGNQDPYYVRDVLADMLGWGKEQVVVRPQRIGGAFGGKTLCTVEREAVRLAKAVGRPVRVQWSRADEFRASFYRPPSSHRVRARLGRDGRLQDWWHAVVTGHVIFTSAALPGWLQTLTSVVPDMGSSRGALSPYRATAGTRRRVEMSDVRIAPPTGPWRGLGASANHLAIERAMDMLARRAAADPIKFRLDHLAPEHARLADCLRALRPWWQAWRALPGSAGVGLAAGVYKDVTPVAAVARVVSDGPRGIRVTHLGIAQDCGQVVNPDQVRAQIEGNAAWGVGMVLQEGLTVSAGAVEPGGFGTYQIPKMGDVPQLEVVLVNASAGPSTGAAEAAIAAVPGAVLNAVCGLSGRDLTRLPVSSAMLDDADDVRT